VCSYFIYENGKKVKQKQGVVLTASRHPEFISGSQIYYSELA